MKKILMIAYHFYPDLESGSVRTVKFAKYLPRFGWQPLVLTVNPRYYPQTEESPLDFPCEIYRTGKWWVLDDYFRMLKSVFKSYGRMTKTEKNRLRTDANRGETSPIKSVPLWIRFLNSLSQTPDEKVGWFVPAIMRAVRLIRAADIDVIYSSGPPWTCHLIGLSVKMLTRKKWVADFRDPWTAGVKPQEVTTSLSRRIEDILEKKVLANADLILTTTPQLEALLTNLNGPGLSGKCATIFNGYDEDDFVRVRRKRTSSNAQITFVHTGTLYMGRDPSSFLAVMGELLAEGYFDKDQIKIKFVGSVDIDLTRTSMLIEQHNLDAQVEFERPIRRSAYLDLILNSDVLILMQSDLARTQIPAKAFEYLATGNQILALVAEGATRDFLSGFSTVAIANPYNNIEIRQSIMKSVRGARGGANAGSEEADGMADLTKRKLTGRLAGLLNRVLDEPVSEEMTDR